MLAASVTLFQRIIAWWTYEINTVIQRWDTKFYPCTSYYFGQALIEVDCLSCRPIVTCIFTLLFVVLGFGHSGKSGERRNFRQPGPTRWPNCVFISHLWCSRFIIYDTLRVTKIWVIDQVWGQDGWILAKFFFCVFVDRDGDRSINSQKENEANIQPSWPNKLG